MTVAEVFTAHVHFEDKSLKCVEFTVIEGKGQPLLGKGTAIELGVLRLGPEIKAVDDVKGKYPELFKGVGKLKDFQLEIPTDTSVDPVIQPMRRIPFNLREKLEEKINELERMDIIEKV